MRAKAMPSSKSRKRSKHSNGQRSNAGRTAFLGGASLSSGQQIALRLVSRAARWGLLGAGVLFLASSSVTDPIQRLVQDGFADTARLYGPVAVSDRQQVLRAALMRRIVADADAVRGLSTADLRLLFGEPTLRREEARAVAWQFASDECALDIYFQKRGDAGTDDEALRHAVYAEYRLKRAGIPDLHKSCVRSLFARAQPLPESGVPEDTPQEAAAPNGRV